MCPSDQPPASSGRHPIATAPRDGTVIVLSGGPLLAPVSGYWGIAHDACTLEIATQDMPWVVFDSNEGAKAIARGVNGPTHWQPLIDIDGVTARYVDTTGWPEPD